LRKGPAFTEAYTLTGLTPGFEYRISVSAYDANNNESIKSEEITVFTDNPDASTVPTLPEVEILEVHKTTNPASTSLLKSLGFAEIEDYGIIYSEDEEIKEIGIPIYADHLSSTIWNDNRVNDNLQVFYNFADETDHIITDKSGVDQPVDLCISHPLNTKRLTGQGLRVVDGTVIFSEENPERLMNSLSGSDGITLEAWIEPNELNQLVPATILAMSDANLDIVYSIEQLGNPESFDYACKINTATDSAQNEDPELKTTYGFSTELLHHVVYTWDRSSEEAIYVNGKKIQSGTRSGVIPSFNGDYQLTLANDPQGSKSWNGTYYLVAIYDIALNEEEVLKNYDAGFGQIVYKTDLSFLPPNTQYYISPFVRTDQGIFFGEQESFMVQNLLDLKDSEQIMAVVPNPSDGRFILSFEDQANSEPDALLRIADSAGKVVYTDRFHIGESMSRFQRAYDLSYKLKSGIYNVILILGSKAKTERLILF